MKESHRQKYTRPQSCAPGRDHNTIPEEMTPELSSILEPWLL